jgi:hypothetical protein
MGQGLSNECKYVKIDRLEPRFSCGQRKSLKVKNIHTYRLKPVKDNKGLIKKPVKDNKGLIKISSQTQNNGLYEKKYKRN